MNRFKFVAVSLAVGFCLCGVVAEDTAPVKIDPLKVETLTRGMTMQSTALEYLEKRGEVILKIQLPSVEAINTLAQMASIDKVISLTEVTAYFNEAEFAEFEKLGYPYEVLVPESMQIPPARGDNDYRGFNSRDDINTFPSYTGYENIMEGFAAAAPEICRLETVGNSVQGRKIMFAVISDNVETEEAEPKVTFTSTMHGDETVGFIIYLKLIQYLINNYNSDSDVKELVDNVEIWINPNMNPDGTYSRSGGSGQSGATRANANGVDMNRCFPDVPQPSGKSMSSAPELKAVVEMEKEKRFYLGADSHGGMEALVMPWAYQKGISAPSNKTVWKYYGNTFMSSLEQIFVCENGPYAAPGTKFDFGYFQYGGVVVCPELSNTKPIQSGQFDYQWNRFSDGYLSLLKEAMYGIHGTIRDIYSDEPIAATIEVEELDSDGYGIVETHKFGDFYHSATTGTYTVIVKPEDQTRWSDTTITGVSVTNGAVTNLDLILRDKTVGVVEKTMNSQAPEFIASRLSNGEMRIQYTSPDAVESAALYSINGQMIKEISFNTSNGVHRAFIPSDVSNGTYFVKIKTDKKSFNKKVIVQ